MCERCGSCCLQISGISNITDEDIRRWVEDSRFDILYYCEGWQEDCCLWKEEEIIRYLNKDTNMEMWHDNGVEIFLCPFLRHGKKQFRCRIHDTKPQMCRAYICDPKDMVRIVKRTFEENLKEYRKKRKNSKVFT
jgi:Fe-S-cluster containining protein